MADKLSKETLVALEYAESRATGMQMPLWAQEYIKEHGIPDPNVVYKRQRDRLGAKRKYNTQDINVQHKITSVVGRYGLNSDETDKAIFEAHNNGTAIAKIARWIHKTNQWVRVRTEGSEEYKEFKKLLKKENGDVYTKKMSKFYRQMKESGVSSDELALWTGISAKQINQLIIKSSPKYIAYVTYYVAIPLTAEPSEKFYMLDGTVKPKVKINRRQLRKRVSEHMTDAGLDGNFETKINTQYSEEGGIDVKIRPKI